MQSNSKGIFIALVILTVWASNLYLFLTVDVLHINSIIILLGILIQTFLYIGLFITSHDAMHGSVCPKHPKINNIIGSLCVWLYALFSYKKLYEKHWAHHRTPASGTDPDFHDGEHSGLLTWYFRFMKEYLGWKQIVGMAIVFQIMKYVLGLPTHNLILFWVSPALLSTLQLFYFGTYLPHRTPKGGYKDEHCAQSNAYSTFWSFITCYHFGYHWEHHEYPSVPWWNLPKMRKVNIEGRTL